MNIITKTFALAATLTFAAGTLTACDSEFLADEGDIESVSFRDGGGSGSGSGGIIFNTPAFGEMTGAELVLGAASPDGTVLNAVLVKSGEGESAQYFELTSLRAENGELKGGHSLDGDDTDIDFTGEDFEESEWYVSANGKSYSYEISSVRVDDGVHHYLLADLTEGSEQPPCPDPHGLQAQGTEAVVIGNMTADSTNGDISYNPIAGSMFFACVTGGVGKTVGLGYKPYDPSVGMQRFETAVRAVRNDICGDGGSWTEQGTPIQLQDKEDINAWADALNPAEAVYGPEGALCVGTMTRLGTPYANISCSNKQTPPKCGDGTSYYANAAAFVFTRLAGGK